MHKAKNRPGPGRPLSSTRSVPLPPQGKLKYPQKTSASTIYFVHQSKLKKEK